MAATKIKGLQLWCRRMTEGYDHVDVANFTTSFRDGMAFCAIIHRFRPDLIDYDSLLPENVYENCKLAFEIAEQELDIPAFLEAEDMARLKAPDKLSVITYVSQYYNILSPLPQLGGPGVRSKVSNKIVTGTKRSTESDSSYAPATKKTPVMKSKENAAPATERTVPSALGDKCGICQKRVYLLERHMEGGKLYHRSCFRHSELSPTNKVYTRSPFMSPSLSSETPSFTYPSTNSGASVLTDVEKGSKGFNHRTAAAETKTTYEASSISKKSEGIGTKHLLDSTVSESTKKSKLQSGTSVDEDKSKKASEIKDRLQNLKAKYSANKSSEVNNALPLSGKEARKLEKKREEILASVNPVDEPLKGTKRNIPLILQQNDKYTSGNSKSDLSMPTSTAVTSSSASAAVTLASKTTTASKSAAIKASASKMSNVSVPSKSDSQISHSKNKHTGVKNSEKATVDKLDTHSLKQNSFSNVLSPQTSSGKADLDSSESSKLTHPVAKPRTGAPKSTGRGASENALSTKQVASAEEKQKDTIPKPAPRRSMLEEKTPASEQPKIPHRKKSSLLSDPAIDEVDSSRLPAVASNPPSLPNSAPPPLPVSAPPPLPASTPVGEITSTLTDRGVGKSSNKSLSQETKSSLHSKAHTENQKKVSSSNISHDHHRKADLSKVTGNDQTKLKYSDNAGTENILTLAHEKSQSVDDTVGMARIKTTVKPHDRRWSSPISTNENQMAVHVVPAENKKEGQVLTGLLTSLSVARDQQSSSPSSTDHTLPPVLSSPMSPSSQVLTSEPGTAHDKIDTETSLTSPSSKTPTSEIITSSTQDLDIPSLLMSVSGPTATVSMENVSTTDINVIKSEKQDSESHKLDFSQNVEMYSEEISQPRHSSLNALKNENNANFESRYLLNLNIEDTGKKSEKLDGKTDSGQRNVHPTPAKRHISSDDSESLSSKEQNDLSSSKEGNDNISGSLKYAILEQKQVKEESRAESNNADAVKDESKSDSAPQKPPRLLKISKITSHEKLADVHKVDEKDGEKRLDSKLDPSASSVVNADGVIPVISLSSASKPQPEVVVEKADATKEMPQWKKDIEERKRKLREDIAKSESETVSLKHVRVKGTRKVPTNSDIIAQTEDTSESQNASGDGQLSFPISLESESANGSADKSNFNKISSTFEESDKNHDLQKKSENRADSLAGCSIEQEENLKETEKLESAVSRVSGNINSFQSQKEVGLSKSEEDFSQISDTTRKHAGRSSSGDSESVVQNLTADDFIRKKTVKLKDSELEFVVNKTKLKSVEIDIDISAGEPEMEKDDHSHDKEVEDDKDVLPHFKQLQKVEDVSMNIDKTEDGADLKSGTTARDKVSFVSNKSRQNSNENNNNKPVESESGPVSNTEHNQNLHIHHGAILKSVDVDSSEKSEDNENEGKLNSNNKPAVPESSHVSDKEHIHRLNIKGDALLESIDLDNSEGDKNKEEGSRRISVLSEGKLVLQTRSRDTNEDKGKHPSPKARRKITILGKSQKDTVKSPPTSPLPMKKIEVTTKFDFEESSSDFEITLTESTARLTIRDKSIPPPRPPPPRPHHKTVPPLQISAIELQQQLLDIDSQLTDLELRGRDLEESIRNENKLEEDDDGLINDWFKLVSERNELVRKEADLVYISKQQDLEDEQEHIESQLRYLISKPEDLKSAEEKQEEQYLIKRKLELVEQRNKIVDSMDEDRMRYEAEDRDIKKMRDQGLWRNSTGPQSTIKERKLSKSVFYS